MYKMKWIVSELKVTPADVNAYREKHACGQAQAIKALRMRTTTLHYLDPDTDTWVEVPTEHVLLTGNTNET